jgi:hypothetical protein
MENIQLYEKIIIIIIKIDPYLITIIIGLKKRERLKFSNN